MKGKRKKRGKLRIWLYDNGLRIQDFAKILNVHRLTVSSWMGGLTEPNVISMSKIRENTKGEIATVKDILDN